MTNSTDRETDKETDVQSKMERQTHRFNSRDARDRGKQEKQDKEEETSIIFIKSTKKNFVGDKLTIIENR